MADAKSVLLVEDNVSDGELTLRALRNHQLANGITWVRDGAEAIHYVLRDGPYSDRPPGDPILILLDLKLPKVDGLQVLDCLKRDDSARKIPIVVLTSSAEDRDIERAYELGANSYLVKPVGFDAFTDVVSRAGLYWLVVNRVP
jgi:two-component system, response regulator